MQADELLLVATGVTVFIVPADRAAQTRDLHPDLMRTAGDGVYLEQEETIFGSLKFVTEFSTLTSGYFVVVMFDYV